MKKRKWWINDRRGSMFTIWIRHEKENKREKINGWKKERNVQEKENS